MPLSEEQRALYKEIGVTVVKGLAEEGYIVTGKVCEGHRADAARETGKAKLTALRALWTVLIGSAALTGLAALIVYHILH